jgi:hypothetical protein
MLGLIALGAAIGAGFAASSANPLDELNLGRGQAGALILLLPLLYVAVIAVHEAGHIAGGLIVEFRPLLFIAGPLRIERDGDGGIRFGVNRSLALAGGLAACTPVGLGDLRRRAMVMVAGGPVVSLMFGTQCLAVYMATSAFLVHPGGGSLGLLTALTLLFLGIGSLLIGLATLLPMRSGGFYSDGARLLRLLRGGEETDREVALLALTGLTLSGARPRDWDPRLVRSGAAIRDNGPFEIGGRHFAFAHALDRGEIDEAREHLEAAIAGVDRLPRGSRSALLLSAATFFALHDADADRARAMLGKARDQHLVSTPHQRLLAEAAVHFVEGDVIRADHLARQAQQLASRALDRGAAALDESLAGRIIITGSAPGSDAA